MAPPPAADAIVTDPVDLDLDLDVGRQPSTSARVTNARVSRPLRAFAWMLGACVLFALMSLCAKTAMRELPWHEVATGRAAFGALTIYALARSRGISLTVHDRRAQWNRTIAGIFAMCFGFYALSRLPLGDAVTLANLTPLMIAIVSHRLLGERSGAGLGFAVVLGFVGVAVLAGAQLQSSSSHHVAVFGVGSAVIGAFCSCMAMIFLRRLGPRESAEGVSLHFLVCSSAATFLLGLGHHVLPSPTALGMLVLAGIFGGVAQVAMTKAYGLDKAARVGAIGYSGVVLSQILGVLVLNEYPTLRQLGGAGLVLLSGLVLVGGAMRERETALSSNA